MYAQSIGGGGDGCTSITCMVPYRYDMCVQLIYSMYDGGHMEYLCFSAAESVHIATLHRLTNAP